MNYVYENKFEHKNTCAWLYWCSNKHFQSHNTFMYMKLTFSAVIFSRSCNTCYVRLVRHLNSLRPPGIHILYETTFRMRLVWLYAEKLYCECYIQKRHIQKRYSETMLEPSFWTRVVSYETFSHHVNVKSIQGSYNWAGLSKTTGQNAQWPPVNHSNHMNKVRNVQFLLTVQIQPPDWTKCKWLSSKTFSCKTIMWILYWYNVVQHCTVQKCECSLRKLPDRFTD